MSLVTIISDASYCLKTKCAGYGFWAVSERGRHAGGGEFKAALGSALEAECAAVVNALHVTVGLGIASKGDRVLIQTDCIVAIHALGGTMKAKTLRRHKELHQPVAVFSSLRSSHQLTIEFRHVKGHSGVQDRRSMAQRHADQRARQAMKKARAKVAA